MDVLNPFGDKAWIVAIVVAICVAVYQIAKLFS